MKNFFGTILVAVAGIANVIWSGFVFLILLTACLVLLVFGRSQWLDAILMDDAST